MGRKGIMAWLVSGVAINLWALLTCAWLTRWVYRVEPIYIFREWTRDFTPMYGFLSVVNNFIFAGLFVFLYAVICKSLQGSGARKGLIFGFLVWLAGWAVSWVRVAITINISKALFVDWMVNGLISYMIAGAIIGWIYRE